MNANSVKKKMASISRYVCDHNVDLLAITETRLKRVGDSALITERAPDGYSFVGVRRRRGRGGGVGLLYRDIYLCNKLPPPCFTYMELMKARIDGNNVRPFHVYVLYRPPSQPKLSFLDELESLFSEIAASDVPTVIVGDFNIHFDKPVNSKKLKDLLHDFQFIQHVDQLTHKQRHKRGHMIDLVISRSVDRLVTSVTVKPVAVGLGDHNCIDCVLQLPSVTNIRKARKRPVSPSVLNDENVDVKIIKHECTNTGTLLSLPRKWQ